MALRGWSSPGKIWAIVRIRGSARIRDVEADRPVVGVHGHLHGVAHVVAELGRRRRVGEPVRDGVAIQEPDQTPRGRDHQVGIGVVPEERGDPLDPLPDVPVDQHPAVRGHVIREEELGVPQVRREQHLAPEGPQRDTALARVGRVDVLVPRRIVEFLGPRLREDIVSGPFAEVKLRAGDPEIAGGHGGDVLDPELGEPLARHPVHRAHDGAVAVRIVNRSLIQIRLGRSFEESSRAERVTCRYSPLMVYRSMSMSVNL